jgi:hypothetical protein
MWLHALPELFHVQPSDQPTHVRLLGDLGGRLQWLNVRCGRCPRHGRLRIARLLAEHGADAAGPDVLRALVGDCPKREAFNIHNRCDPYVPGLAG